MMNQETHNTPFDKAERESASPLPSGRAGPYPAGDDFRSLARKILHLANTAGPGLEFEREVGRHWLEAAGVERVEFHFEPAFSRSSCRVRRRGEREVAFESFSSRAGARHLTDAAAATESPPSADAPEGAEPTGLLGVYSLFAGRRRIGQVVLAGRSAPLTPDEDDTHRGVAEMMALALLNRRSQWALRERVKELTCLYGISRLTERGDLSLDDVLRRVVALIPQGWQYPEITQARLSVDERTFTTPGFRVSPHLQSTPITARGEVRGRVEVVYTESRPEMDEGPFLSEERNLLGAVATSVGLILEERRAAEDRRRLEEQLRHADRLATIGQLAAGVAHELNEPLGAILGFAQLARQSAGLADQAARDVDKILAAALHAREVVRKLMLFARQTPPRKGRFSLNELVEEGLYFLESRCERSGIVLERQVDPALSPITADRGQMQQVLVNLAVNAVQAMPGGGTLTLRTRQDAGHVFLVVEDTGVGMTEEVRSQLFVPFFTTKEVGQGTGLGLSVVHGIVSAHGGGVNVESRPGKGSRFEIRLPLDSVTEDGGPGTAEPPDEAKAPLDR